VSYSQYLQGKAIQTGCDWRLKITINSAALEEFPSNAHFLAHIRDHADGPLKAALSTEDGTITRMNSKTIELIIPATVSASWQAGTVVMDVLRVDTSTPIHLGFDLEVPVKRTITRP